MKRVAVFLALAALAGCGLVDPCTSNEIAREPAPNGERVAIVYERECGETTPVSTHVGVLEAGADVPTVAGNAFAADSNEGAALDGPQVAVEWKDDATLVISYDVRARVFTKRDRVGDVTIRYRSDW